MNLENAVVLVTGANRGLGLAFARELLARGARKVYSGARDPATVALPGVQPIRLNVTRAEHVPDVVVRRTLDALEAGAEEVLADDTARDVKRGLSAEPAVYLQDIAGWRSSCTASTLCNRLPLPGPLLPSPHLHLGNLQENLMSTTMTLEGRSPTPTHTARTRQMLQAPLLPTLFRLATPNVVGLLAMTVVIGYDGFILGRAGADALAGIALVFPLSMLMLQMSSGGVGGAVTAAVARALGGGRNDDADRLAQQALLIAVLLAAVFTVVMLGFGRSVFGAMGGRGAALDAAVAYSNILFGGAAIVWSTNVLSSVVRGTGNMLLPSLMLLAMAFVHLLLCPLLVFGWGPIPGLGVPGAAISTLCANAVAGLVLTGHLLRRGGSVHLNRAPWRVRPALMQDILRVGLPASLSPVISNGSIAIATAFVGSFGTAALAGYGIAARLEYILVPIAFGFGTALTAMVATNMGAGQVARALRVAWVGGALVGGITGAIGLAAAVAPSLWMDLFTADAAVRAFGASYLNIVGGCYGLFGLGLALFFASQGAGRMLWPLIGSMARLVIIAAGGWISIHVFQAGPNGLFLVVAVSLAVYGLTVAAAIHLGNWKN